MKLLRIKNYDNSAARREIIYPVPVVHAWPLGEGVTPGEVTALAEEWDVKVEAIDAPANRVWIARWAEIDSWVSAEEAPDMIFEPVPEFIRADRLPKGRDLCRIVSVPVNPEWFLDDESCPETDGYTLINPAMAVITPDVLDEMAIAVPLCGRTITRRNQLAVRDELYSCGIL